MVKPLAEPILNRLYRNVYVCMRCNATLRSSKKDDMICRKCGSKSLRQKNREKKG